MNHLDILLPFGLPQAEMARDLLRECRAPALAMLLGRGNSASPATVSDPFARALPHEHWLAGKLGLPVTRARDERGNSPPAAAALLHGHADKTLPREGHWFVLQPAHIHVARDHLVLTDIGQLALSETDSRRLFDAALPLFTEIGRPLLYLDAATWLMRADDWAGLLTSSPQAASGRNIDIWMPTGPGEQAWRKLQNEVQMQWFVDELNEAREQRGHKPINALWLWGGADVTAAAAGGGYQSGANLSGWARAQAVATTLATPAASSPEALLASPAERGLLLLDTLLEPGLTNEWGFWLERIETLDRDWFAPLLQALRDKRLHSLSLVLSGADRLLQVNLTPSSLRKFWAKPSLSRLAP